MRARRGVALVLLNVALASSAHASTSVFADTFDSYGSTSLLNWVPQGGWFIGNPGANGTVDYIANGAFGLTCSGNAGACIDLAGSTNSQGLFSHDISLTAGVDYTLTFQLSGNQRSAAPDNVTVDFGAAVMTVSAIPSNQAFTSYLLSYTPARTGTYTLSFLDAGPNGNIGSILDNVSVSAVPEPGAGAMIAAGLLVVGVTLHRRGQRPRSA